jgi:beta-glucosidase
MLPFPKDFLWGVATASFQIEGGVREGGKSPSTWDTFVHTPGRVRDGATADVACDSYHRYLDDVRCMRELGVGAYRFSIAWPRVLPAGRGALNPAGVDYYHRLIDALLAARIEPWITLYHWDLPQVLEDEGGWQRREMAETFRDYAVKMVELFGDRVTHWAPFNEIQAFVEQGYGWTIKAPGLDLPAAETMQVLHHVLLGHGLAARAMRQARPGLLIGTAENPLPMMPVIETPENLAAAHRAWDRRIGHVLAPLVHGAYPDDLDHYPADVRTGDMAAIQSAPDFMGLNVYNGNFVEADDGPLGYRIVPYPKAHLRAPTETWIDIAPEAAYWGARLTREKYGDIPIYILENGYPTPGDASPEDDRDDLTRIMFVRNCLAWLQRAIAEGVPFQGYFLWSLIDSFEWISGKTSRFGLYRVDWDTLERTPRRSAEWYREVIRRNALV